MGWLQTGFQTSLTLAKSNHDRHVGTGQRVAAVTAKQRVLHNVVLVADLLPPF